MYGDHHIGSTGGNELMANRSVPDSRFGIPERHPNNSRNCLATKCKRCFAGKHLKPYSNSARVIEYLLFSTILEKRKHAKSGSPLSSFSRMSFSEIL
jgi:hypothetical protein